jgi:hypothetical protein
MKSKLPVVATILIALLLASACSLGGGTGEATTAAPPGSQPPAAPADTQAPPTAPPPTPSPTVPPKPKPTRVEFQAEDGRALVGYYYPSPYPNAPLVVLMHMMGVTQLDWVRLGLVDWLQNWPLGGGGGLFAPALQTSLYPPMPQGVSFAVFTFDYRGMGENLPEMPNSMTGSEFDQWIAGWLMDSEAAYEKAKNLPGVDPTRMAGIGASIGADGVVDACGEGCLGALSLSPGDYLNVKYTDAVKAVDDAGKPVWCIAHEKDKPSADACKAASGEDYKSILYTEGGGQYSIHGMMFLSPDLAPPDIGQNILDFLLLATKITP